MERRKSIVRIAGALIFILWLLVLVEGSARLLFSLDPIPKWATGYDASSYRLQWVRLHRAHVEINGVYSVYHPTRGWSLQPRIDSMRVFDGKVLNTNSKGLRGNTEYDYQRIPGKHRVVVLGDSFTFGTEVSDKETYSHYLESALPNTEVLNFGVQGYGQDQMLLYLQEEGIKYKPDVVVVGYVAMDTHRNLLKFFGYAKPKFNLLSSRLELTDVPVPTPDQVLAREPYRSKAVDLLLILHERLRWRLGKNEAEARELARAILDEIVATTRQAGAVPVIVYLPVNEEIVRPDVSMDVQELDLYDYCQNRGIPCLFPRQQIHEKLETGDDFRLHGHWNAMTHELAAREIADFVIRKGLIQSISSAAAQR